MDQNRKPERAGEHDPRPDDADEQWADALASESILSLDSTLPPTPLKQLLAADGASVYVLSNDSALARTVQEAGGEQYPIHTVDDWPSLVSLVEEGSCRIVLLDAHALPIPVEQCLDELRVLTSRVVVLIAADRDAAQSLIGLLSQRRVHRLLIKPATTGVTRLLLESAVNRYLQIRDDDPFDMPGEGLTRRPAAQQRQRRTTFLMSTAVVVLGLAFGLLLVLGPGSVADWRTLGGWSGGGTGETAAGPPSQAAAEGGPAEPRGPAEAEASAESPAAAGAETAVDGGSAAAEPAAIAPEAVTSDDDSSRAAGAAETTSPPGDEPASPYAAELEQAEAALAAGRLAAPSEDNALARFRAILAEAPDHRQAQAGLETTLERLYGQAEESLVAGDLDEAGAALDAIRRVRPDAARLTILDAQLTAARARAERDAASAPPAAPSAAGSGESPVAGEAAAAGGDAPAGGGETGGAPASADTEAAPPPGDAAPAVADEAAGGGAASAAGGAAAPASDAGSEFERLLTTARARIEQGRLVEPDGESARDYLQRARTQNPDDPRLVALREELAAAAASEARVLLDARRLDEARTLVDLAFELGLEPETQTQLDLELAVAEEQAVRAERARWLELARARIQAGALTAPEDDSAWHYLTRLESEQPGHEGLDTAWSALADALAGRAGEALDAGDFARAEGALASLERIGEAPERLASMRERLDYARRQAEFLREPAAASEVTLVEAGSAEYPADARRADIEGWADVEFVVDENGVPRDPRVVAAEPAGFFEEAALESVRRSRYEPYEVDGRTYERLVRVRVRFGLR